ncbi:MAG TPA: c-type cytochrome [Gaiellaceae bacterium]|nr:c-type cytochrome [Gaiellaceae bacterium]
MRPPVLAAIAVAAALLCAGCGTVGTVAAGGDVGTGKTLFTEKCGACHTLADAGTKGTVGPNLDDALGAPAKQGIADSTLRDIVRGQIAYASPPMPQDLVTGDDADAVATYVAQVAGQPVQGKGVQAAPAPGATSGTTTTSATTSTSTAATSTAATTTSAATGTAPPGKAVFTANCSTCHTLKDAGATGTVGPDLDQLKPSQDVVAHQVENGGAIMPAFKGTLTAQQIEDVASYVSSVAGK